MKARNVLPGLILLVACMVIPSTSYAQAASDNSSVGAQLNGVKPIVAKIKRDAVQMQSYTVKNDVSWNAHAKTLTKMRDDVNQLQDYMRGLQSHRTVASQWQQDAIDRITKLANDLATNMNATIDHLNQTNGPPILPPYPAYLKANTQIVSDLSDEIDATINYGRDKATLDRLGQQVGSSAK